MEQAMAAPTQNQAQVGPPVNVLHDQNNPNTLGGIGPPTTASDRLPVGVLVAAVVLIVAVLVLLVVR
jgi:hypothetical protein